MIPSTPPNAERADATRLGDCGDERVIRHAAHARKHDRVLDVEHLGQARLHATTVVLITSAHRGRRPGASGTRDASDGE